MRTSFCDLVGVQFPILQAGMGPFGSDATLAAAVSNAGALGTVGGAGRPLEDLRVEIQRVRELTDRPFVVNFTQPWLQDHRDCFQAALSLGAPIISLALGDPGDLPKRAHDAGALFIQQVHTLGQARQVTDRGVDVIVAQGTEAGGFTGSVAMPVLVPQVVDAVGPIPVLAAGGIADGRGLAIALILGAQGVNVGTRFLARREADISEEWKQLIVSADATDARKIHLWDAIFPKPAAGAFDVVPRSLTSSFIRAWEGREAEAAANAAPLSEEVMNGIRRGEMEQFIPFTGQSAGLITDVLDAADVVEHLVKGAMHALQGAARFAMD